MVFAKPVSDHPYRDNTLIGVFPLYRDEIFRMKNFDQGSIGKWIGFNNVKHPQQRLSSGIRQHICQRSVVGALN